MDNSLSAYIGFRCPRWNELPGIELYMDQVVSIIEADLAIFRDVEAQNEDEGEPAKDREKEKNKEKRTNSFITPTMINNYVKNHIIPPPVKKKYSKEQLALLHIICVGKRVLSMSEIKKALDAFCGDHSSEQIYDAFCEELEAALAEAFGGNSSNLGSGEASAARLVLRSAARAFAYKVYSQCIIEGTGVTAE